MDVSQEKSLSLDRQGLCHLFSSALQNGHLIEQAEQLLLNPAHKDSSSSSSSSSTNSCNTKISTDHPHIHAMAMFDDTAILQRVVFTHDRPYEDLVPELHASMQSWYDPALPHLQVVYYDNVAARAFLEKHFVSEVTAAWDTLIPGAFKADLFRLCEIFLYGGVYVDVKCTRAAPYAALIGPSGTLVIDCLQKGAWNGFFAAPCRAPWVACALVLLLKNVRERFYGAPHTLDITGPGCFGRGVRQALGMSTDSGSCDFLMSLMRLKQEPHVGASAISSPLSSPLSAAADVAADVAALSSGEMTVFAWTSQGPCTASRHCVLLTQNRAYESMRAKTPIGDYGLAWRTRRVFRSSDTFEGTDVPKRLVCFYDDPCASCNQTCCSDVPDLHVAVYDPARARAFFEENFPRIDFLKTFSALPAQHKAELFGLFEIFVNGGVYMRPPWTLTALWSRVIGCRGSLVLESSHASTSAWTGFFAAPPQAPWIQLAICDALSEPEQIASCLARGMRRWLDFSVDAECSARNELGFLLTRSSVSSLKLSDAIKRAELFGMSFLQRNEIDEDAGESPAGAALDP